MGLCYSCFKTSADDGIISPSAEARRRMQLEAAERRRIENETRGIKDPEKVRRQQMRAERMEQQEEEMAKQGLGNPSLKWQTD
uniref:Small vcp/p97-interacting protein n=1 Tax=Tabanus bromius TaxID=304241 RepID=A0A0K8TNU3_TABBR